MSPELELRLILILQSETGQFELLLKGMGDQERGLIRFIMRDTFSEDETKFWSFPYKHCNPQYL